MTASIGVSIRESEHAAESQDLLHAAALYTAKDGGRNCVVLSAESEPELLVATA